MTLKGSHTFAPPNNSRLDTPWGSQLPKFDRPVQTAADQIAAIGRKGHRVHAILVSIRTLQPLHQLSASRVPHAHRLVQRPCCDVVSIRRHGHRRHSILDRQRVEQLAFQHIPQPDRLVSASRCNVSSIAGIIQRVYVLFMPGEDVFD